MKARGFTKAEEIAQWGTAFTANPGDLSLILGLYGGRRDLTSSQYPETPLLHISKSQGEEAELC